MMSLKCAKHALPVQVPYYMPLYNLFLLKLDTLTCDNHFYILHADSSVHHLFTQLKLCWLLHVNNMKFYKNCIRKMIFYRRHLRFYSSVFDVNNAIDAE